MEASEEFTQTLLLEKVKYLTKENIKHLNDYEYQMQIFLLKQSLIKLSFRKMETI